MQGKTTTVEIPFLKVLLESSYVASVPPQLRKKAHRMLHFLHSLCSVDFFLDQTATQISDKQRELW